MYMGMFSSACDIEEIDLCGTPTGEDCTGVNPDKDYMPRQRAECRAFIGQLKRQFAERLETAPFDFLKVKANPHDFGTYYSVVAKYRGDGSERAEKLEELAYFLQDNLPEKWDDTAKTELAEWDKANAIPA